MKIKYVNGADLNESQKYDVQAYCEKASDIFWVERHNFPFDENDNLLIGMDVDIVEDEEMARLQREDEVRDFDKEARYILS